MRWKYIVLSGAVLSAAAAALIFFWSPLSDEEKNYNETVSKWADIFSPSVFTRSERLEELSWFSAASADLRDVELDSASEDIETHYWESRVLAKAFREITGIRVTHNIIPEGVLVPQIKEQIETGKHYHDIYVNDADSIGWHLRTGGVVNLSDYMSGEGNKYTDPFFDLSDYLNIEFGQDYDGNILQLPDQQFVNLYWFRYDWFTREDIKKSFKARFGYELGVPTNWEAYEDIALFFTTTPIDGSKVYGHLDYGKPSPSLGWRFTDAWFSIAGVGDKGLPNGSPVDEWGIRVENRIPVGSSVTRGGEINGPAAVYALETYIRWLRLYAPAEAARWEWADSGPVASRGDIAQQIFEYATFLSDARFHTAGSPVCDRYGKPLWRVAPTPYGRYWDEGMKVGYQDAGSWTIPKDTAGKKRAAAWMWAQFCNSKTVALKKFLVGGTPVRRSTVFADYLTDHMEDYGGIIEFYRSRDESKYTGTGRNVPYYPGMAELWWKNISRALTGEKSPQSALDQLAQQQDAVMGNIHLSKYSPVLNREKSAEEWLEHPDQTISPKKQRPPRKPETRTYDEILKDWKKKAASKNR